MEEFTLRNQLRQNVSFLGVHLAHSDSIRTEGPRANPNPLRHIEMDLYKTEAGVYVLDRAGVSNVYHVWDGPCDRGVATLVRDLPKDARICPVCRPSRNLTSKKGMVDLEEVRHEINECPRPEDVLANLVTTRKQGPAVQFLSLPAKRLLEKAAEVDEGIRRVTLDAEVRIA